MGAIRPYRQTLNAVTDISVLCRLLSRPCKRVRTSVQITVSLEIILFLFDIFAITICIAFAGFFSALPFTN